MHDFAIVADDEGVEVVRGCETAAIASPFAVPVGLIRRQPASAGQSLPGFHQPVYELNELDAEGAEIAGADLSRPASRAAPCGG